MPALDTAVYVDEKVPGRAVVETTVWCFFPQSALEQHARERLEPLGDAELALVDAESFAPPRCPVKNQFAEAESLLAHAHEVFRKSDPGHARFLLNKLAPGGQQGPPRSDRSSPKGPKTAPAKTPNPNPRHPAR